MAKQSKTRTAKAKPAPQPAPPQVAPQSAKPPDRRYSMTELAALCGVTEQTVRRWWKDKQVPEPVRHGRTVYWPADLGNTIIDTYRDTGRPSVAPKAGVA